MAYTESDLSYYLKNPSHITSDLDIDLKLLLIDENASWINYMKPYNIDIAKVAFEKDPSVFKYIDRTVLTIQFIDDVITRFPMFIQYVYEPSIPLIKKAINADMNTLQLLKKIPTEIYEFILKKNGLYLKYIRVSEQTENLVRLAIAENIEAYRYSAIKTLEFDRYILNVDARRVDLISEYRPELIEFIVNYNPKFITKFYSTPEIITEEIKKIAVTAEPEVLRIIKNPSFELMKYAITLQLDLMDHLPYNDALVTYALSINGLALKYVKKKDLRTIKEAVKKNVLALKYVEYPRQFLIDYAFKIDGLAIQFIKSPTKEQYLDAIKRNGFAIEFIPKEFQTKEIQMFAMAGAGVFANKYITPIDEEVTLQMLRLDPGYIFRITNPTETMYITAFTNTGALILFYDKWETKFNTSIKEVALTQDGTILERVVNKSKRLIIAALKSFPFALAWVKYQDLEMAKLAVSGDVKALFFVDKKIMDTELLNLALQLDPEFFTRTAGELTYEQWLSILKERGTI